MVSVLSAVSYHHLFSFVDLAFHAASALLEFGASHVVYGSFFIASELYVPDAGFCTSEHIDAPAIPCDRSLTGDF